MILEDDKTVYENITEGNELIQYGSRHPRRPRLRGALQLQGRGPAEEGSGECSGGMRNRVLLARMLRSGGNVILLDEPTNDLDLDTLRVLENAIEQFPGSAIVVSHDRWFLNRLVSHILAFEGDGYVNFHHGTYESYVEWREGWREKMNFPPESHGGALPQAAVRTSCRGRTTGGPPAGLLRWDDAIERSRRPSTSALELRSRPVSSLDHALDLLADWTPPNDVQARQLETACSPSLREHERRAPPHLPRGASTRPRPWSSMRPRASGRCS